jgi:aromatic ring hydroxylase
MKINKKSLRNFSTFLEFQMVEAKNGDGELILGIASLFARALNV